MFRVSVSGTRYSIEVDQRKDDCCRERPHCHILEHGRRIGQFFFHSGELKISHGYEIIDKHWDAIYNCISQYESEMIDEYYKNANG